MTDRELLELAARAAGYKLMIGNGCQFIDQKEGTWCPLSNDGDALRLAVKLSIHVRLWIYAVEAEDNEGRSTGMIYAKDCGGDMCAATRRAIVIVAALVGDSMNA